MTHTLDVLKVNYCDIDSKKEEIAAMIEIKNSLTEIIKDTEIKESDSQLERFAKEDIREINQILKEIA